MSVNTGKQSFLERVPEYRIRVSKSGKLFLDRTFTSFQKMKRIMEKLNGSNIVFGKKYYATNTNNDTGEECVCW